MTNRTVQILGQGFGSAPAAIQVTLGGTEIYNGAVPTLPLSDLPVLPNNTITNDTVPLMTFEVPVTYSGTQAMTCKVTTGTVIFAQIRANYSIIVNPVFTPEDVAVLTNPSSTRDEEIAVYNSHAVPAFTPEEITLLESTDPADAPAQEALLASHTVSFYVSSGLSVYEDVDHTTDPRDNVTIDGTPVLPDHGELPGTWWYRVGTNQTLGYDLTIAAGLV